MVWHAVAVIITRQPAATPAGLHIQDYLEWKRSTTKNPATVKMYERWVRRYLQFLEGDKITLESIGRFRTYLTIEKEYSPKNIQYGLQLIRDYISYQITVHRLDFPLKLLKIPQERSNSHTPISYDEYQKMIDLLPLNEPVPLQRRLMLSLLWETGMRGGELLRLRISDLSEQQAVIHNEKNHRNRLIGWSENTEKLLRFYLPLRKNLPADADWLFVSFKYRPCRKMTVRQLERIVEELRKKIGTKNEIRPHSFRHGFVHRQLEAGKPITTIAQMLGHSTTLNVLTYAQLTGKEIREAWKM